MNIHKQALTSVVAIALIAGAGLSSAGAADAPQGYNAFRLVRTRNIFDPERRAIRPGAPAPPRSTGTTVRPPYIALTGALVTPQKTLAFFSGSRSEFNKVIAVRDKIADFTLTKITPNGVELEHKGKSIAVSIGNQIPLEGSTAAESGPATEAPATAPGAAPAEAAAPEASPPPATEGNDVLRRMMERRQKETK